MRYFSQTDPFKTQVDVDDGTGSDTSSVSPDVLSEDEGPHLAISRPSPRIPTRERGWSPSIPLPDSSDEEADDHVIPDVLTLPGEDRILAEPSTLSTFRPVLNQNVFHLTPSQDRDGKPLGKRSVLLLTASDSIALLGTYSISLLQGTIILGGVTLVAPSASLPVFAPRSAPLPIIRCVPRETSALNPPSLQSLPPDIANVGKSFDATIVLQELQTGIEGLGKICRTFDGFFAPSRWNRHQARFDLGLDTVYFVRFRINSSSISLSDVDAFSSLIKYLTSFLWTSLRLGTLQSKLAIR